MMGPQAGFASPDDGAGEGWLLFAAIILAIVGVLNVIYGIAAIGDSSFFAVFPSRDEVPAAERAAAHEREKEWSCLALD